MYLTAFSCIFPFPFPVQIVQYMYLYLYMFNGVTIKEWINIYKAMIEFIQVVSKLWHEKKESREIKLK